MATRLEQRIANAASGKSKLDYNSTAINENLILHVSLNDIVADENQPRKDFGDLEGLKASIKSHGILTPIILSTDTNNQFRIIAGERRYRASKELNLDCIPAIVRTVEEQTRLEIQIIENLHRKDLNPFEEAKSYQRLMNEFNLNQKEIAERIGKSRIFVNEILKLLDFTDREIEELSTNNAISKSVLLEIARNDNPEKRIALLQKAKSGHLTVKEVRTTKSNQNGKSRARIKSHRFSTSHGEVIIKINGGYATIEDLKIALQETLEQLGEPENNL